MHILNFHRQRGQVSEVATWINWKTTLSINAVVIENKKAVLWQRWPRHSPYIWVTCVIGTPILRPRLLFPKFFMGFCSDRLYSECAYKIWSPYSFTRFQGQINHLLGPRTAQRRGPAAGKRGANGTGVRVPLSLRVSEILPLLCCSMHFSPPYL